MRGRERREKQSKRDREAKGKSHIKKNVTQQDKIKERKGSNNCVNSSCLLVIPQIKHFPTVYLKPKFSPVHIVTKEQERGWSKHRTHPPQHLLKAHKIMEISMQITYKKHTYVYLSNKQFLPVCLTSCTISLLLFAYTKPRELLDQHIHVRVHVHLKNKLKPLLHVHVSAKYSQETPLIQIFQALKISGCIPHSSKFSPSKRFMMPIKP